MSNARYGLRVRNGLVRGITEGLAAIDPDALAFITAAGITDLTQIGAINGLVLDLKAYGLWTKMKAIYPFVGGTANTHKYNLKDPQDTNAAFRLQFIGGWTHSSTGAAPNGTNGYADTFINPDIENFYNYCSLSYYSRTNTQGNFSDIGSYANAANGFKSYTLQSRNTTGARSAMHDGNLTSDWATNDFGNSQGFFAGSRTSNTVNKIYRNGILGNTNTVFVNNSLNVNNATIYIGAANLANTGAIQYSGRQSALAAIGYSITDTEAANFYTAVQTFQTTLGRQV